MLGVTKPQSVAENLAFESRRSPVYATRGACCSSQPLASEAGLHILRNGGNAADACVAMAAALNVTEPCSTGIGGDAFCLYFNAEEKEVKCLLGNGKSPKALTHQLIRSRGFDKTGIPPMNALNVTVPGAAAAWCDIVENFGTLEMKDVLKPATDLARDGFAVSPVIAYSWKSNAHQLLESETHGEDLLVPVQANNASKNEKAKTTTYRAPVAGEVFKNPHLASVFDVLAAEGKQGFYSGWIGESIVQALTSRGGVMTLEDLTSHASDMQDPIMTTYRGVEIYQVPPPTQGVVALMALNLMEEKGPNFDEKNARAEEMETADRLHLDIECTRAAFAEAVKHVGDPRQGATSMPSRVAQLISKEFARSSMLTNFDPKKAADVVDGQSHAQHALGASHDTVYFCAVDQWGNGCSMINSNYMSFGTGIVPKGCGFSLQNRGHGFAHCDNVEHPNCIGPEKRPYHTIIPGLATHPNKDSLYATFGVMGGFMQPQGHAQVLRNMLDLGMDPQMALDAPRFFVSVADYSIGENIFEAMSNNPKIFLESPISEQVADNLRERGHKIVSGCKGMKGRTMFGRGQIIKRDPKSGVLTAGSDPRADGAAMGF